MRQLLKRKRNLILLLLPISFLCLFWAKNSKEAAEQVFATHLYRYISIPVSRIFGVFPFSVAEIICYTGPVAVTILMVRFLIHMVKGRGNRPVIAVRALINVLCVVSILTALYLFGCGINYYRYPFSYYSNLEVKDSSKEELYELCTSLAVKANELRSELTTQDNEGVFSLSMSDRQLAKEAQKAYVNLSKEYPVLSGWYPAPKTIMLSRVFSRMEITGIFVPFTMESNVNVDISDYSIPSTMCHELAHLHGFMREDEANYIAYLACMASDSKELQYSGVMEALIIAGNALYGKDTEAYYNMSALYSDQVRLDLSANNRYWKQFENTTISVVAQKVNDSYLKANAQEDGVESYGRMVDLLLAKQRAEKAMNSVK